MQITKIVNGKTFVYQQETLDAFRHMVNATVDALTSMHKTKESVAQARVSWFIATAEKARKPYTEDQTLEMLSTKQKDMKPAQLTLYNTLSKAWNRFKDQHDLDKGAKRGKPGSNKAESDEAAQDVTPKANNAKTADSFIRQQAAMLSAYGEKNRALLSHAMLSAIAEFREAVEAVTPQD